MSTYKLINGDCIEEMKKMDANSIDSIVTDPPYGLVSITKRFGKKNSAKIKKDTTGAYKRLAKGFMGKEWDGSGIEYNVDMWKEALRVLKPGGHMLAFSSTRTYHRMVCAIEDSGFEIRDQLAWIYGSGFPKSQNVGKMIDKKAGAKRKVVGKSNINIYKDNKNHKFYSDDDGNPEYEKADITEPSTELAKKYDGWGTALKPAQEPIVLARKPLSEKTVAANVIKHTTGAINIDGCRVATDDKFGGGAKGSSGFAAGYTDEGWVSGSDKGRWPANIIHDGSAEVLHLFPDSKGGAFPSKRGKAVNTTFASGQETVGGARQMNDNGSAARFFYCAKANKHDRDEGCEELDAKSITNAKGNGLGRVCNICSASILKPCDCENNSWILPATNKNNHPTVKPTMLMQYLIKLITPVGGTVLDPFNGSGSTGKAAMLCKDYNYIGIDLSADYIAISKARIEASLLQNKDDNEAANTDTESIEENNFFIE